MRFFQAIFLGVFLLSNAEGKETFHVKGPFDLDRDKVNECLILNSKDYSILFVEVNSCCHTSRSEEVKVILPATLVAQDSLRLNAMAGHVVWCRRVFALQAYARCLA